MSRALRELGLGPDADERAVKRAYAARLKVTRPDTDPEGFQRLNAAYQAALAWVQSRSNAAPMAPEPPPETDIGTEGFADADAVPSGAITRVLTADALFAMLGAQPDSSPGDQADLADAGTDAAEDVVDLPQRDASGNDPTAEQPSAETVRFDFDVFFHDCVAVAMHGRDGELLDWLNAQPILWSLAHKAQIAHWLVARLHEHRPAIGARRFDVLAEFFGLLDIHAGYDAYFIQRLRHRMHLAWEIQTMQTHALAQRGQPDGGSFAADLRQTRRILNQLRRPFHLAQVLHAGLVPMYPSAVRKFMHRLDFGDLDDLPPPLDRQQIAFWDAAGNRHRFSRPRWMLSAARVVAYSIVTTLILTLLAVLNAPENADSVPTITKWPRTMAVVLATMTAFWLAYLAQDALKAWQALPESGTGRETAWMRRLRTATIPLLGLGTLIADRLFLLDGSALLLSTAIYLLALHRYRRRSGLVFGGKLRFPLWRLALLFFALLTIGVSSGIATAYMTWGITAVACALWAVDLRKQRAATKS